MSGNTVRNPATGTPTPLSRPSTRASARKSNTMPKINVRHHIFSWVVPMAAIVLGLPLCAQPPGNPPPPVAKAGAPIDLTGYWVSIVTEDWRYRMVMPAAGDYQGVPMTAAALKVAREWAPGKDGDACKAYG